MKRPFASVLAALVLAPAAASAAEPSPEDIERARTFYNAGAMAYGAGRFGDALRAFERAYEITQRPTVLFALAQAERKEYLASKDPHLLRRALQHYEEYLAQVESGGRRSEAVEAKADLEARLARLDPRAGETNAAPEKRKARITVYSATPGAMVSIDGGKPEELPYFGDLEPGKHRVRVFADGYFDAEQEVSGDRPVDVPVNLPLREKPALVTVGVAGSADVYVDGRIAATTPLAAPIEVPSGTHVIGIVTNGKKPYSQEVTLARATPLHLEPRLETSGQRVVSWVLLAAGGAAIVTGGVSAVAALVSESDAKDIEAARQERTISADELRRHNELIENRDTFRTAAIVTASVGAAFAAAGLLLYAFDKPSVAALPPRKVEPEPKKREPMEMEAAPVAGPGMVGGAVTARF